MSDTEKDVQQTVMKVRQLEKSAKRTPITKTKLNDMTFFDVRDYITELEQAVETERSYRMRKRM